MATTNKPPTDGKSLERRREMKREIESDRRYDASVRNRAAVHRSIVGNQLPAMYAKGSFRYVCAFRGRPVTADELQSMRDSMRVIEPADAT